MGSTVAKPRRQPAPANGGSRSRGSAGGGRTSPPRKQAPSGSGPDRVREIVALVLFAVAVFLIFCLGATEKAGVMGRGIETALVYAFGRLAFLVPVIFIAVGVTTVFEFKLRRSLRFLGVGLFLFGLFLLMAGGFPPFGGHSADLFVRNEFETHAGGLGEAFYGAFHALVGVVGVGIIGWVLELAGFSLVTGVTARWLGKRTTHAARVVKTTAERSTLMTRRREDDSGEILGEFDFPARSATLGGGLHDERPTAPGVRVGPIDLVAGSGDAHMGAAGQGAGSAFGDAFDEWTSGRPATHSPVAPMGVGLAQHSGGKAVLDGAEAFADLYGHAGGGQAAGVAAPAAGQRQAGESGAPEPAALAAPDGQHATAEHEAMDMEQEPLPGLARTPRQIELAVSEPSYVLPLPDVLRKSSPAVSGPASGERDTAAVLLQALSQFGVQARVIGMVVGPRVTRYELHLAPGTKVAKVSQLKDDLAYALASTEIRILAPIPGKSAVGVEVPNQRPDFVTLGDIYREFPKSAGPLMVWLGKDISGKAVYADLTRLPHLLIAGTTGSGKSGCVNCLVSSVLLRSNPEQVRMIMIDPKKVELSHYDRIPHLLVPVVTNMKDAAGVLHNVVKEMEDRYELMELDHARSLGEMNKTRARRGERPIPYILIVIDELADLMMTSPQEVEDYVIRIAQKARAVGIHLVVATQRPSADVITGMIKANIPSRIAFAVSSQTDSRVILDINGAETLLGMGDMLFKPLGSSHLQRVQGAYITEDEIALLVSHWRHQAEPEFREELLRRPAEVKKSEDDHFDPDSDELLADAAQLVIETGSASVSMLQRRLRVGYTRAGRLIDMLERRGIVGPWEGSKPRQILIDPDEFEHVLGALRAEEHFGDGEDLD
ncbi:MAG: hypothetical protein A2133_11845 [Actinobacteria bacterium RBG_16_64_13]|nr:MAG: hypothetical protein A2133_11845 [Actinobacteria bacterium RBG_16_64_13]